MTEGGASARRPPQMQDMFLSAYIEKHYDGEKNFPWGTTGHVHVQPGVLQPGAWWRDLCSYVLTLYCHRLFLTYERCVIVL